jgi:hypothetical protein
MPARQLCAVSAPFLAGLFIWDNNAPASIGYREIDFEYSRWGNAGDPTAAQYVLEPLRPGNLPGWKVRWQASGMQVYLGSGQGSGGCNNAGQTNFNGAGLNYVTCAMGESLGGDVRRFQSTGCFPSRKGSCNATFHRPPNDPLHRSVGPRPAGVALLGRHLRHEQHRDGGPGQHGRELRLPAGAVRPAARHGAVVREGVCVILGVAAAL